MLRGQCGIKQASSKLDLIYEHHSCLRQLEEASKSNCRICTAVFKEIKVFQDQGKIAEGATTSPTARLQPSHDVDGTELYRLDFSLSGIPLRSFVLREFGELAFIVAVTAIRSLLTRCE